MKPSLALFAVALLIAGWFAWMLDDLRQELKRSAETVNTHLPEILDNTRQGAATLAEVSRDIKDLRNLAGVEDAPRDRSLVAYADSALDLIESQADAVIGTEKLFGKALSDPVPAKDWTAAARKEAVWLTFRAASKRELLDRLTATKFGSAWRIQAGDAPPIPLRDWLVEHHPATKAVVEPAREAAP